ncbi:MAG: hypothetical protein ACLQVN_20675 [Bryobacteraceae bacterium]
MSDPIRKNKMISLRLSEDEYALLRARYSSYGARNVSDLARLALDRIMGKAPPSDAELLARVNEMNLRLNAVEQHVALLLDRGKMLS